MGEPRRFFNPSQPQTLQIAVWLLYLNAVFYVIGGYLTWLPFGLLIVAATAGGAFGVANEQKWGYAAALASAFSPFLLRLLFWDGNLVDRLLGFNVISLMFEVALVCLLLHPMSRDYQRIWFK